MGDPDPDQAEVILRTLRVGSVKAKGNAGPLEHDLFGQGAQSHILGRRKNKSIPKKEWVSSWYSWFSNSLVRDGLNPPEDGYFVTRYSEVLINSQQFTTVFCIDPNNPVKPVEDRTTKRSRQGRPPKPEKDWLMNRLLFEADYNAMPEKQSDALKLAMDLYHQHFNDHIGRTTVQEWLRVYFQMKKQKAGK